jgi:hypothetical protein
MATNSFPCRLHETGEAKSMYLRGTRTVLQRGMKRRGNPFKGDAPLSRCCRHATMRPTSPEFRVWLQEAVSQWEKKMMDEVASAGSSTDLELKIAPTGRRPERTSHLLLASATTFSRSSIDSAVDCCKSLLHGRGRARLRATVNSKVRELQEAYTSKKFAHIIWKLGYKEPIPQDPHSVVLPTGEITTTPVQITFEHMTCGHLPAAVWVHNLQYIEALLGGAPSDQLGDGIGNSSIPAITAARPRSHLRSRRR